MDVFDVTDAELAVVKRLWESPGATIRELTEALYPGGTTVHYATVQKLLERLEAKKCVKRFAARVPHRFRAIVREEDLVGSRLKAVADKFCEGSLTPLLTHLIRSQRLSQRDIAELQALIQERGDKRDSTKSKRRR